MILFLPGVSLLQGLDIFSKVKGGEKQAEAYMDEANAFRSQMYSRAEGLDQYAQWMKADSEEEQAQIDRSVDEINSSVLVGFAARGLTGGSDPLLASNTEKGEQDKSIIKRKVERETYLLGRESKELRRQGDNSLAIAKKQAKGAKLLGYLGALSSYASSFSALGSIVGAAGKLGSGESGAGGGGGYRAKLENM